MKVFTRAVKYRVFDCLKNNDYSAYKAICAEAENSSVLEKIRVCYGSLRGFQADASVYFDEYTKYING